MATGISARPALEPVLAQGLIEKAFPGDLEACTERVRFSKEDKSEPHDGGYAMKRGILAGAAAEHELYQFAREGTFTIDLGQLVDRLLAKRRIGGFPPERLEEMRSSVIGWVRQYQAGFPLEDPELDWSDPKPLLRPQTDLFLWRPDRFRIRVRPDLVVGVGETLVAVEFSTARDPGSISPARVALNYHALLRERLRREEWSGYRTAVTRIEMLALGYGFIVPLDGEQAERWRVAIGKVAEDLLGGRYRANPGEYCSGCPWQVPCRLSSELLDGEGF